MPSSPRATRATWWWVTRVSPRRSRGRSVTAAPEVVEVEPVERSRPRETLEHRGVASHVARQAGGAVVAEVDLVGEQLEVEGVVVGPRVEAGDEVDRTAQRVGEQPRRGGDSRAAAEEWRGDEARRAERGRRPAIAEDGDELAALDRRAHREHGAQRVVGERDDAGLAAGGERAEDAVDPLGVGEIDDDVDRDVELLGAAAHDVEAAEVSAEQEDAAAGLAGLDEQVVVALLEAEAVPLAGEEEQAVEADLREGVEVADDAGEPGAFADALQIVARRAAGEAAHDRVVQHDQVEEPAGDAATERAREQDEEPDAEDGARLGDVAPLGHCNRRSRARTGQLSSRSTPSVHSRTCAAAINSVSTMPR